MKRFVLTGAPGAGKTALLRQLERDGFGVVEEAATDVIALEQACGVAEPWTKYSFVDLVIDLQKRRQQRAQDAPDDIQFHDRSAVCTAALAVFLGYSASEALTDDCSASSATGFSRSAYFLLGRWASSSQARRAGSALKTPYASNKCTKRPIASMVSRSSPSNREASQTEPQSSGAHSSHVTDDAPYPGPSTELSE
jgi:predicted ATPase